jgi:hypothetical protein
LNNELSSSRTHTKGRMRCLALFMIGTAPQAPSQTSRLLHRQYTAAGSIALTATDASDCAVSAQLGNQFSVGNPRNTPRQLRQATLANLLIFEAPALLRTTSVTGPGKTA